MVLFIKIMSLAFPSIIITMKYCVFIFKSKIIRILHHHIQDDWKMMQSKLKNDIIQKYAHNCQAYTIFIYLSCSFLMFIVIIIQFLSVILDFVLPLDEPRPRKTLITVKYFICQDNYFYTKVFHEITIIILFLLMMLAMATQLLLLIYHSYGMFKITSHRIKHSIDSMLHISNREKERTICKKILHIVIVHNRTIQLVYYIFS
ncbi:hypothetical protein P5V15_004471 [Pogonomyrmex californicus]